MTGRHASRSKNGCTTCRRRKVKCGEEHPTCRRCSALRLPCEWGAVKRGRSHTPVQIQPARSRWPASSTTPLLTSFDLNVDDSSDQWLYSEFAEGLVAKSWESTPDAWTIPTPLYPSLSGTDFACSNSLMLSEQDKTYFQYFPSSSLVFYYIKSWQWSSFSYLYQYPAASSKAIMRMILALSASDMHRKGLIVQSPGRPTAEDHGRYHYGLAVKEFRELLENREGPVSQAELEIVFALMFLMISYEWQFGQSVRDLRLHLRGVRSLLETHPHLFDGDLGEMLMSVNAGQEDKTPNTSFIPEQWLLWILYIDSGSRSMGATDSLYKYVLESGNAAIQPDRLYRCARLWGRCFWASQYPEQEVSDDIENYRGLELIHAGMTLRYRIWQALSDDPEKTKVRAECLLIEIMAIRERFSDLFLTTKFAGTASTRRTLITIDAAVSTFYAQVILHRRLLYPPGPPSAIHRVAVSNITEIVKKQYAWDPRLVSRLYWPLLMAVIDTEDVSQREWLRQRLFDLRNYHSDYLWASDLAEEILSLQDASQGEFANVATLFRREECRRDSAFPK